MRLAGSESWRVGRNHGDQALHVALYVRDRFQIVANGPDVPPSLIRRVPTSQIPTEFQNAGDLCAQWLWWWRHLTDVNGRQLLGSNSRDVDKIGPSQKPNAESRYFDPFDGFQSLDAHPQLQGLVTASWKQGIEWSRTFISPIPKRGSTVPREVAKSVIAAFQVSPERVNAGVIILAVQGHWSTIVSPGVLLCSDSTYADDARFSSELRRAFESQLN